MKGAFVSRALCGLVREDARAAFSAIGGASYAMRKGVIAFTLSGLYACSLTPFNAKKDEFLGFL